MSYPVAEFKNDTQGITNEVGASLLEYS